VKLDDNLVIVEYVIAYSLIVIVIVIKWFSNHVLHCNALDASADWFKIRILGILLQLQIHWKVTYQAMQMVQPFHLHEISTSILFCSLNVMLRESTRFPFLFRDHGCSIYFQWSVNIGSDRHQPDKFRSSLSTCWKNIIDNVIRTLDAQSLPGRIHFGRPKSTVYHFLHEWSIEISNRIFFIDFVQY
jgi:hypothetical protein